jgi:DNA-binding protein Fis
MTKPVSAKAISAPDTTVSIDPTDDVRAHVSELATRCEAMLDGAEIFLPLATSVLREVTRVDEDLARMKRRETDDQVIGFTDGMEQRHRALQSVVQDLQRQVQRVYDIARELVHVQRPFLEAVEKRGSGEQVRAATFPIMNRG